MYVESKYISMYIYPLSRIHNTSLVSAYFGVDKRESLEYLVIYYFITLKEVTSTVYVKLRIKIFRLNGLQMKKLCVLCFQHHYNYR
jgi:hypothetical protein